MDLIARTLAEKRVARIASPAAEKLGFEIVRIRIWRSDMQIMAERIGGGMDINDCVLLSRSLSPLFETHAPLEAGFKLEVSSPGIDRPLTRLRDFTVFSGSNVSVSTHKPIHGRRRFRDRLLGLNDNPSCPCILIHDHDLEKISIPFENCASVHIVPDDTIFENAFERTRKGE